MIMNMMLSELIEKMSIQSIYMEMIILNNKNLILIDKKLMDQLFHSN